MNSLYTNYQGFRAEGFAPGPAAEATARLYDKTDPAEIGALARTLARLEERDAVPVAGGVPTEVPSTIEAVYRRSRRAGRTHEEAEGDVEHAFSRRNRPDLRESLRRPRLDFERETEALEATPTDDLKSTTKEIATA